MDGLTRIRASMRGEPMLLRAASPLHAMLIADKIAQATHCRAFARFHAFFSIGLFCCSLFEASVEHASGHQLSSEIAGIKLLAGMQLCKW